MLLKVKALLLNCFLCLIALNHAHASDSSGPVLNTSTATCELILTVKADEERIERALTMSLCNGKDNYTFIKMEKNGMIRNKYITRDELQKQLTELSANIKTIAEKREKKQKNQVKSKNSSNAIKSDTPDCRFAWNVYFKWDGKDVTRDGCGSWREIPNRVMLFFNFHFGELI